MNAPRTAASYTIFLAITTVAIAVALVVAWFVWPSDAYASLEKTFDDSSEKLLHTVIVPTLDTPIPEGKSAIWCSSFQMAWNRLRDDVVKEPVVLKGAEALCDQLNQAKASDKDVASDSFYAAAGLERDEIADKVRKDMAQKFPAVQLLDLSIPPNGALAYGYLTANIKYRIKYNDGQRRLSFPGSDGKLHMVGSFGFQAHAANTREMRGQAEILFASREDKEPEFVIDLCLASKPNQIIVARIPLGKSLAEALAHVREKTSSYSGDAPFRSFNSADSLLVPNMSWKIFHRFRELEDKEFANGHQQSLILGQAIQLIDLAMDRSGAELESQALTSAKTAVGPSRAKQFMFDGPFLLYLKKRGAEHPFFVMWVANAELLQRMDR